MKSFNFYRHSLVVKHILMLLAMIFLILGIGFGIVYHSVQTLLIKSIHEKARTICRETINQFDQPFFQCESIAKTFAADLASCPQEQWPKILESTFKSLSFAFDNIDIFSFGEIAITKWENGIPSGSWSAIVHINDQFIPYQDLEDTKCDWVLLFGNNKEGLWYEPSFSRFTKDLIAAYSCPVMQTMPDGSKKMIGAVLISLNASWLHQKASEIQLGKNSNVSLFSTKLQCLSNRNKKLIGKRIDQLPPEELSLIVDESLKQKLKQAKDGKYLDNFTARDVQNGKNVVVFTQIMKSTSWIFSIEFSEDEIYFPVRYFRSGICGVIIVTVIALLLAALLLTYRMSVPLRKITQFAEQIGKGDFSAKIPAIKGKDEIAMLTLTIDRMRSSLIEYIQHLKVVTSAQEKIASELQIARTIQAGLLPDVGPSFPNSGYFDVDASMIPAKEIGGDMFDCAMLTPDKLRFVIGDVSGKGIPASLFMAITQMLQRILWQVKGYSPKEIVNKMNNVLASNNGGRLFVTFLCGSIDAKTGIMTYCNAGHDPFYILKKNGSFEAPCEQHGMPLGLCDEVDYTESEYKIEPGDTIVLYTDGIPEAENATDEFYQMERFTKLLQSIAPKGLHVNEIGREIRESVHDFSGDREPNDDSTYMVIRYKKSAE